MFEIKGKYSTARCYASNIDNEAINQIKSMCDIEFSKGQSIAIMPDAHAGKGCTIGTTMTIKDKVVPGIVGVDIGCGMYTCNLGNVDIDFNKLDEACHYIPSGKDVWSYKQEGFNLTSLRCFDNLKNVKRLEMSLGSLGGGNHFIEVDVSNNGTKYLIIHSGSRNLGTQVANYYQNIASKLHNNQDNHINRRTEIINSYREQGRYSEIQSAIDKLDIEFKRYESNIPDNLCWLYGTYFDDYIHDMVICQEFALKNRELMSEIILDRIGITSKESFHTVHNYIDTNEMILRKGAIAAHLDEVVLIPLNMRDGSIIASGLGNPDWNYSAPHGAGRVMSRKKAKSSLSIEDYRNQMKGIYSTSISFDTLDESPMAYKRFDTIMKDIQSSVSVIERLRPIYNFKSQD